MPRPSIFDGNERQKVRPVNAPRDTKPRAVSKGLAKALIQSFEEHDQTVHSNLGSTVWVIITYCIENNIPYRLDGTSKAGFVIHKL